MLKVCYNQRMADFRLFDPVGDASGNTGIQGVTGIGAGAGSLQASLTNFTSTTSVNSGALGFTPVAAFLLTSDGTFMAVGYAVGTAAGDQNNVSFTNGLFSGLNAGFVSQASWSCSQFTAAGVICSGASRSGSLLVIGQ